MRRASLQADVIPKMSRHTYINDYVPEPAWAALQGWADRGAMPWWPKCASRDSYLAAYRVVQAQLNPTATARACFNNPPARSYLALHVRRGDRAKPQRRCGKECTRQGGDRLGAFAASASTVAVLLLSNSTLHALRTVSERDGRPWLVISDNQQTRIAMELLLRAQGLAVISPQPAAAADACAGLAPAEAAEAERHRVCDLKRSKEEGEAALREGAEALTGGNYPRAQMCFEHAHDCVRLPADAQVDTEIQTLLDAAKAGVKTEASVRAMLADN